MFEDDDPDMVGVTDIFIQPPDGSDSEGNDNSGDEGESGSLGKSILQVKIYKKKPTFFSSKNIIFILFLYFILI